jgi:hypothetical protein
MTSAGLRTGRAFALEAQHARDAGPGVRQLRPAAAVDLLTGGHAALHAVALMKAAPCSSRGGRSFSRTLAHGALYAGARSVGQMPDVSAIAAALERLPKRYERQAGHGSKALIVEYWLRRHCSTEPHTPYERGA